MNTACLQDVRYGLDDVAKVARSLVHCLETAAVMTFQGSLGAGKTTLIQELLHQVGVKGSIQSPTFTYVQSYRTESGTVYHHFDLYRILSVEDFLAAGFEEYLYQPHEKVLIEWPEVIMPLLTHDVCHVVIDYDGIERRHLTCHCL